jgi:hypothetical protein
MRPSSWACLVGVYERAATTPSGRIAVIRREDTFTLAPWRPALELFRCQAVIGVVGPTGPGLLQRFISLFQIDRSFPSSHEASGASQ